MKALTQEDVDEVLEEYRKQSQAVKERVFDIVVNSNGSIQLDDAYNMEISDLMLLKQYLRELVQIKNKNLKRLSNS